VDIDFQVTLKNRCPHKCFNGVKDIQTDISSWLEG